MAESPKERVPFSTRRDLAGPGPDEGLTRASSFLAKSLLGLAPGGGTAAEFLGLFVVDPTIKRIEAFLAALASDLDELRAKGPVTIDQLAENGEASALLLHAIQIASRSEGRKKLQALRIAAVRGAASEPGDRSPAHVVMGILDRMTEIHIQVLSYIAEGTHFFRLTDIDRRASDLVFGEPTFGVPDGLREPKALSLGLNEPLRYVEAKTHSALFLAHSDLMALGLLAPIHGQEYVERERTMYLEENHKIVGHTVSQLGRFVLDYIKAPNSDETSDPSDSS